MGEIERIIDKLIKFRDERDWKQFHDSKNLAAALSIEAAELNELFLWKNDIDDIEDVNKDRLSEELADVIAFAFLLAEKNNLNIQEILINKIQRNSEKYPIEKAKGTAKKYTEL